jgi:drug/metabolite transporter (DMT)-like permease
MCGRRFVAAFGAAAGVIGALLVVLSDDQVDPQVKKLVSNAGFVTCGLAAAVCCGLATRAARGRVRRAWLLLTATASCWWVGSLWWAYYQLLAGSAPYPSVADLLWLAALAPAAAALLSITPGRDRGGGPARAVLDAAIVAGSVLFISEAWCCRTS